MDGQKGRQVIFLGVLSDYAQLDDLCRRATEAKKRENREVLVIGLETNWKWKEIPMRLLTV